MLLQQQRNNTGIERSVAKKRKAKDLWQKADPRAMKFRKELNNRGLTIPEPATNNEIPLTEELQQDSDGGTYADAVKRDTEQGIKAKIYNFIRRFK